MNITKPYGVSAYSFPEHVMPVDLAMHAQISSPVSQLLGMSTLRASPPSMSSPELSRLSPPSPTSSLSSSSSGSSLSSYSPGSGTLRKKKRVVFADTRGLALESVRIFTVDPSETEPKDAPEERVKARTPMQSMRLRLKLGFPQPVVDCTSVKETLVQLESCSLAGGALSGTVRVRNIKFDKTVFIRITFDSWRSYKDIPCTYVREPQANLETDLFAFKMSLPSDLNQKERLEFVVVFRPGNNNLQFVDHNKGKNYQINVENMPPEPRLLGSEPRLVSPETRLLAPEPRLVAPEARLLAPEARLSASETRLVAPEPRLLVTEHRKVVPEPRLSQRSFVIPSPQRFSAWPGVKRHDLSRMKNLACKGPPYTDRLVNRNWTRMTNAVPLC